MNWKYQQTEKITALADLEKVLLKNRGISDPKTFFKPLSPLVLNAEAVGIDRTQIKKALLCLKKALETQADILVFGDYDADGICATAVMWLTLHELGFNARPFIPHRSKHGYGLSEKASAEIVAAQKPALIITVDNGIVAHAQVEWLNQAGIEVIITDHHQPEAEAEKILMPAAVAVIHTTQLCGTTVAWMMAKEIWAEFGKAEELGPKLSALLDLCGVATIADQVPLQNANRSFAIFGIKALQVTTRPGFKTLYKSAAIDQKSVNATTVNYVVAPRINAMGRLDHGLDALRLLCTRNTARAEQLASTLSNTNTRRQTLTEDLLKTAIQAASSWENEHLIFVASETFHEGVIGLIAGKLMEIYHKPAIVLAVGRQTAKASARSIPGVNIVELVRQVRDDLLEVGGHPMAAGFGLRTDKLEIVQERLQKLAKQQITSEVLKSSVLIEALIDPALITEKLLRILQKFEPFGQGNPQPILALKKMRILDAITMGKEGTHLKLSLSRRDAENVQPLNAIVWRMGHKLQELENRVVDVAAVIEVNEWKGRRNLQLIVKDLMQV